MTIDLSREQARLLLLRAQGLTEDRENGATVASVVHDRCGLQAQDYRQAPPSIRARSFGLTAANVEAARVEDRSIVRTWCMRGTLHFVTVSDLPWILSLFGPLFVNRGRRRLADLGFADDDCDHAVSGPRVRKTRFPKDSKTTTQTSTPAMRFPSSVSDSFDSITG